MPMSPAFEQRLTAVLPAVVERFGTPFHIYDAAGIGRTCEHFERAFAGIDCREYFAVKALPNPAVLRLLARHGLGFDTSSPAELTLARAAGATGRDMCFTSSNTSAAELAAALDAGAMITVDDEAVLNTLADRLTVPGELAFRVNPGRNLPGEGDHLFGDPEATKFGVPADRLTALCARARDLGVREFGLHMMVASNVLGADPLLFTLDFLLERAGEIEAATGRPVTSLNLGGGIGIPYRPQEQPFDLPAFGAAVRARLAAWGPPDRARPAIRFECGRYITGPHGALVTRVTNRMAKWRTFAGVDAGMVALMRPALYSWAYHHITAPFAEGREREVVDVVGSLPENSDRLGRDRDLPVLAEGDVLVVHDTGAHGHAMGFNYTGRGRPQELMLHPDGSVELIRRAETEQDLFATLEFAPRRLAAPSGQQVPS
ncbi:diaminopimelate decarboxylase [Spongiactinospora gelatinilytica]|uniref:Diaminopimelate decarboxylase n=1 Tax=Spongiactinospora gelatinilytica TaxID=2666298 RepID=A0A2W2HAP8_9ACTN|nr:diaminopimelate decarboxylase [Spongiactinospora gelatinilytica]PZG46588.1 diaminopimelate decarboxylase [Spongiactinospora gelatinilytica]